MIALVIFLVLLWIRPEYMFLLFYIVANTVIAVLLTVWSLTPDQWPAFAIAVAISDTFLLALGAIVVALRKWLKTRKTGADKRYDAEMERIRAEIAARENQPPPA